MTHTPTKGDYALDSRGVQTAITRVIDPTEGRVRLATGDVVIVSREAVSPAIAGLPPYLRLFPVKEQDAKA